ncbi:MAG: tetratricopeptide repeat protein [bacterium]|nr:tetratricopeptide repeat protein [bacterium]
MSGGFTKEHKHPADLPDFRDYWKVAGLQIGVGVVYLFRDPEKRRNGLTRLIRILEKERTNVGILGYALSFEVGKLYVNLGDEVGAIASFARAVEDHPRPLGKTFPHMLGKFFESLDRFPRVSEDRKSDVLAVATKALDVARAKDPKFSYLCHYWLGYCYEELGDLPTSLNHYEKGILEHPKPFTREEMRPFVLDAGNCLRRLNKESDCMFDGGEKADKAFGDMLTGAFVIKRIIDFLGGQGELGASLIADLRNIKAR